VSKVCTVCKATPEVLLLNKVAVAAGKDNVLVPDTSGADRVIAPLVLPEMTIELIYFSF
jgi:hypothetical protein